MSTEHIQSLIRASLDQGISMRGILILCMIERRPCTVSELIASLGVKKSSIYHELKNLGNLHSRYYSDPHLTGNTHRVVALSKQGRDFLESLKLSDEMEVAA